MTFRLKIALLVFGGMLLFFGYQEWRLGTAAKSQPQAITCARLAEAGPGDNAHVLLGDFAMLTSNFVYESSSEGSPWKTVWVPAVPLDGQYMRTLIGRLDEQGNLMGGPPPVPSDIRVIVKTNRADNESELDAIAMQDTLQGVVVNEIASLGSEEKEILQQSYPGIDFDRCWIVEHGRLPASLGKVAALGGGGAILMAAGIAWFALGGRR